MNKRCVGFLLSVILNVISPVVLQCLTYKHKTYVLKTGNITKGLKDESVRAPKSNKVQSKLLVPLTVLTTGLASGLLARQSSMQVERGDEEDFGSLRRVNAFDLAYSNRSRTGLPARSGLLPPMLQPPMVTLREHRPRTPWATRVEDPYDLPSIASTNTLNGDSVLAATENKATIINLRSALRSPCAPLNPHKQRARLSFSGDGGSGLSIDWLINRRNTPPPPVCTDVESDGDDDEGAA